MPFSYLLLYDLPSFLCLFVFAHFFFFSSHFVSLKSPSSELLFTPTPPPLPYMRTTLSPELQAITSEWISLTLGVSRSSTPALTPPLPPLPDSSLCNIDYLLPSAVASPSPSISFHHSNFSNSSTPRSVISPLPSRPQSSTQNVNLTTLQSEDKFHSPSPQTSYCNSPYSIVGSPDSFLSELNDVIGHQDKVHRSRGVSRPIDREDWIAGDKDCSGTPEISRVRCLRPSELEKRLSSPKKALRTFEESKLIQEQGNGPKRRDMRNYKPVEQRENPNRALKVLYLHACVVLLQSTLCVYAWGLLNITGFGSSWL